MKAISTVIASILMLMIVIALGGTAYLYISGTFTGKTATAFEVIDEVNGTVTIRNSGTETITSITATLDGNAVNIAVTPNIGGLSVYWSMNDGGASQISKDSADNNDGRLGSSTGIDANDPQWASDGRFGNTLGFDGSNDYVEMSDSASNSFAGPFSISLWVNIKNFGDVASYPGNPIIAKGDRDATTVGIAYNMRTSYAGQVVFDVGDDSADARIGTLTTNVLITNRWYHIVGTWDGGITTVATRVFINSEEWAGKDSFGTFAGLQDSNQPVQIGRNTDGGTAGFFDGAIDEVAIFNRALSEGEIKQLVCV